MVSNPSLIQNRYRWKSAVIENATAIYSPHEMRSHELCGLLPRSSRAARKLRRRSLFPLWPVPGHHAVMAETWSEEQIDGEAVGASNGFSTTGQPCVELETLYVPVAPVMILSSRRRHRRRRVAPQRDCGASPPPSALTAGRRSPGPAAAAAAAALTHALTVRALVLRRHIQRWPATAVPGLPIHVHCREFLSNPGID